MRNFLFSFFGLLSTCLFAQNSTFQSSSQLNTWTVGSGFGLVQFYGDIKEYDWGPAKTASFNEMRFGTELHVSKMLNNLYGFKASISKGRFAGLRRSNYENPANNPLVDNLSKKFSGDFLISDLSIIYNFSNLQIKTLNPFDKKILIFGEIGLGLISFRSIVTQLNNNSLVSAQGYLEMGGTDTYGKDVDLITKKDRVVESIFKFGITSKYSLNKKIDIYASLKSIHSSSDYLDATQVSGRDINGAKNDNFIYFSLGLFYHLGSKKQSMEWYSPLDNMYHHQKRMNKQIMSLTKDVDGDGVADQFDTNSTTPVGVAVDGSGNALDVDMDGVSDHLDVDPFTRKDAKVDKFGKELDSDFDGVPDSEDLEPNTEKELLVNHQGIGLNINNLSFLPSLYFSSGSVALRNIEVKQLAVVAKILRDNQDIDLIVIGHTDSHGDVYSNHQLGMARANVVIEYLHDVYGIDKSRLFPESKGETIPLALTPAIQVEIDGRGITFDDYLSEINRRVDFEIVK